MFFCWGTKGDFFQLPTNALDEEIFTADGSTLNLDHQENEWKGVCVYQEHNVYEKSSPMI